MKKSILILAVALTSCQQEATETHQNGNFKVEFLFEQDGCKMYRFQDGGSRTVYWANCEGRIQADYESHSGKHSTTHREETIVSK